MSERRALVAGGHPATVAAAAEVLVAGGNAYDAIVAAGFAAAIAEPGLTSLGGGGFVLACTAEGEERVVDFFVDTPGRGGGERAPVPHLTPVTIRFRGAEQIFHAGYGSVAVPGCLAGYLHTHRRWGRLPLADVVRPARQLALDGVVLNAQQAEIFGLLEAIFSLTDDGVAVFSPAGTPLREGDRFRNPLLADFLDTLALGAVEGFDAPVVADPLVAAMDANDGLLTHDDLRAYGVVEREPLVIETLGARVLTNPPPSFGGSLVTSALQETEGSPPWSTPEGVEVLADALIAMVTAHRSPLPRASQGTTHTSVADADGNLASMTTSNGSCSGVFVPGTGVQLNNIMGEEDLHPEGFHAAPPGVRVGSMMAPTVLELADGQRIALGSGGSERIRSALTLAIGHLCRGTSLSEAVERPRLHWDGTQLQAEPGWDAELLAPLVARHPVNEWAERNLYFGGVHAVSTSGEVAGDPRRGGSTAVVELG